MTSEDVETCVAKVRGACARSSRGRGSPRATRRRSHDVVDRLDEIVAPTLVIHGDADPLVPIENGRYLAAGISGAELIVYEGVGRIPEVECFERFNDDLVSFLA